MTKVTKKDMFNAIKAVEGVAENADMVAFLEHEIELLEKKAANKKATKTQEENAGIKDVIVESLAAMNSPVTVTDLQNNYNALSQYSNQRISALLRQLVEDGKVVKTVDKKKSYFAVA